MQNLRGALSKVQSATTSLFKSPEEVEGRERSATATQFSVVKRRVTESVLQNFGKIEGTPDPEFDLRRNRFDAFDRIVTETRLQVNTLLGTSRTLGVSSGTLASLCLNSSSDGSLTSATMATAESSSGGTPDLTLFRQYAENINKMDSENIRSTMENNFLRDVILPLESIQSTIAALKNSIRERDNLKLDFDARTRKLRDLKLASTTNVSMAQKIPKKEEKLRKTGIALTEMTEKLFTEFDNLERLRYSNAEGGYIAILNNYSYCQKQYLLSLTKIAEQIPNNLPSLPLPTLPKAPIYGPGAPISSSSLSLPSSASSSSSMTGTTSSSGSIPVAKIDRNATTVGMDRNYDNPIDTEEVLKPTSTPTTSGWKPLSMGQVAAALPLGAGNPVIPSTATSVHGTNNSVRDLASRFSNNNDNVPPLPPRK